MIEFPYDRSPVLWCIVAIGNQSFKNIAWCFFLTMRVAKTTVESVLVLDAQGKLVFYPRTSTCCTKPTDYGLTLKVNLQGVMVPIETSTVHRA